MLRKYGTLALLALVPTLASAATDNGLLIRRTSSTQWQVQLYAGTEARQFSGVIESTTPLTTSSGLNLESADSVKLLSADTLGATLSVWPRGSDGFTFAAPSTAQLCLRDTGSSNLKYYVGDSLATAQAVTLPYALTGADACSTGGGNPPPPPPPPTGRKYHPGHYVALMHAFSSQTIMEQTIKPGITGFMKRYTWRELETSQGVYDFTEVQSDLAWMQAHGLRLIIMIEDKTFKNEKPLPDYLSAYEMVNRKGGYTAVRWAPTVVTREKALLKALGQKFDSNASLEGIAPQEESAPSVDNAILDANGYTAEKYRDSLIDLMTDAGTNFPTSRVFWFMNFLPRNQNYVADVVKAIAPKGGVLGGPDVMPDDASLQNQTYPFYHQFEGKINMFGQVEGSCYRELHKGGSYPTKYWTMPEKFSYAHTNLHVNYMIWVRLPTASPSDSYDWTDALPVIANNPSIN